MARCAMRGVSPSERYLGFVGHGAPISSGAICRVRAVNQNQIVHFFVAPALAVVLTSGCAYYFFQGFRTGEVHFLDTRKKVSWTEHPVQFGIALAFWGMGVALGSGMLLFVVRGFLHGCLLPLSCPHLQG